MRRSTLILGAGGLIVLVGAWVLFEPWLEAWRWQDSPVAVQAQRNAAAPQVIPVRPAATLGSEPAVSVRTFPTPTSAASVRLAPAAATTSGDAPRAAVTPTSVPTQASELISAPTVPAPTPTLGPAELQMGEVKFQFQDPPQPGANVQLTVAIHNPTDQPGGPLSFDVPLTWLSGYRIQGVDPLPIDGSVNGERVGTNLRLTVDGPVAGEDLQVTVSLVTTDEVIDGPDLRILDSEGREVGHAQPPTEAPPGEPGPVYAIDIPRLNLHTGVVQVEWEPPLFVVGQLRASAHVTEGNSVLVGHVRGVAGYNVFDHLDQLHVGDQVIASSRGESYQFVVSQTEVLPQEDTSPTQPTNGPRLTLMTCAGDWNPLTRDYPDRLWVVAEPVEVAAARAALEAMPTPLPGPPALVAGHGGLGNTDTDLAETFGAPVGETNQKLAVYRREGIEHQSQLVDIPAESIRRAAVVVEHASADASLTMEQAVQHSRGLLPKDAQPRAAGPEGNARFVVERFFSAALARNLPADGFALRNAQPGELLVVYARRPDGRVSDVLVGIGDDPSALLGLINLKP